MQELKEENRELARKNADLSIKSFNSPDIAEADRSSRKIINYLAKKDFEDLKKEVGAEFTLNKAEDEITFTKSTFTRPFPVRLFSGSAYINNIYITETHNEVAYFINDDLNERAELIYFTFDSDWNFESIGWGH